MGIDSKTGAYLSNSLSGHIFDESLAKAISKFFENEGCESVADFGCGPGWYTDVINKTGSIKCDGYDANPNTKLLADRKGCIGDFYVKNLTELHEFDEKYDWILCLEVGEHIPSNFEDTLIKNLHNNNKNGIILSWAIVGQDGPGHVNCKNNDYIKAKFKELNYENDLTNEQKLRDSASVADWFKNTLMVFRKNNLE